MDKNICVACGMCADGCPEGFRMGADGLAEGFQDLPAEALEDAQQVAADCPVGAIFIS
ncbi:ferredoxin [Selenomonas ruminantium]|uniref:ferredoxin n=1 Tax=Selenomonas ruminantium TaxID=971 RepID=UPI0021152820|nr:ferredoxin [Selenomonas ruminantium]